MGSVFQKDVVFYGGIAVEALLIEEVEELIFDMTVKKFLLHLKAVVMNKES